MPRVFAVSRRLAGGHRRKAGRLHCTSAGAEVGVAVWSGTGTDHKRRRRRSHFGCDASWDGGSLPLHLVGALAVDAAPRRHCETRRVVQIGLLANESGDSTMQMSSPKNSSAHRRTPLRFHRSRSRQRSSSSASYSAQPVAMAACGTPGTTLRPGHRGASVLGAGGALGAARRRCDSDALLGCLGAVDRRLARQAEGLFGGHRASPPPPPEPQRKTARTPERTTTIGHLKPPSQKTKTAHGRARQENQRGHTREKYQK